jgi:Domain of unknown function (DUF4381)
VNPQAAPSATPVPIQDIVGPIAFFPYPIWMVVAAVLAVLALIGLVVWLLMSRRKPTRLITPDERAMAELEHLRSQVESSDPYPFSITVSDVLRTYLHDAHGLGATTQTSREFLEAVGKRNFFGTEERTALEGFLEKADLIKFARMHATSGDCAELLDKAVSLVKSRTTETRTAP